MNGETSSTSARRFPRAAPDGLIASVLLAFLGTAGIFYVNIMSSIVAGLVDGLGASERQAGLVGAANVYGAALGALIVVFLVDRIRWRPVAIIALVLLITIDLSSTLIRSLDVLAATRFLHGLIGGALVGIAFSVIARTRSPDRVFAMLLVVQFGLGGLGVMVLPPLAPLYGTRALFYALAGFSAVTLLMTPFLDDYPMERQSRPIEKDGQFRWKPLGATLASVFLFQAGNMALGAYVIGLGRASGLSTPFISAVLGWATWIGVLGCGLVAVIGARFGRWRLLAAAMVITLAGTFAFHWSGAPAIFIAANVGTAITWSFVISYLLGMSADFDHAGRASAMAGFASKMGLASGPFLGGMLIANHQYGSLIDAAVLLLLISALAMVGPAMLLDRAAARAGHRERGNL